MKRRWLAVAVTIAAVSGGLLAALAGNDGEVKLGAASDADRRGSARPGVERGPPKQPPWRPLSIAPRVGDTGTVFRLTAPTSSPNRASPDNYPAFELAGPGGRRCRGRLRARFGLGFDMDDATRRRSQVRYVPPQRRDPLWPSDTRSDRGLARQPWCPGRYRVTAVELRFKDAETRRVIGRLAFEVRPRHPGAPEFPTRASHGVTRAHFGKDIVGIRGDEMLARLGEPKDVPPEYRRSNGQRCLYYDAVSPAAGPRDVQLASSWQFCLRHGRVRSASGSPAIPVRAPP